MASIGVKEKRDGLTVTVKLYGPSTDDMKLNIIQLKNFVRAITNKHTIENEPVRGSISDLCKAIANETLSVYSINKVAWAECGIETDNGYLYSEAAEL